MISVGRHFLGIKGYPNTLRAFSVEVVSPKSPALEKELFLILLLKIKAQTGADTAIQIEIAEFVDGRTQLDKA